MRVFANICLQELKGCEQKAFNFFKSLASDKLDKTAVYLPDSFFMDQGESGGFH